MARFRIGRSGGETHPDVLAGSSTYLPIRDHTEHSPWIVTQDFPSYFVDTTVAYDFSREARRVLPKRADDEVREMFEVLRDEWMRETARSSSLVDQFMNSAYQRVIGLGVQVIPLIIEDMRKTGALWFWALAAIAGEDKAVGSTNVDEACKQWILWAENQGFVD